MQHIHLDSTPSTQNHLLEHFSDAPRHLLISCEDQTNGFGRRGRQWDSYLETLCFSATVTPNKNLSLTALEMPLIIKNFFMKEYKKELSLKWPNDLMRDQKKCGGIIINSQSKGQVVLGCGINIGEVENLKEYSIEATSVFPSKIVFSKRSMAAKIYRFILDNRLSQKQIIEGWLESCAHVNQQVVISEDSESFEGIFKGIGAHGQALMDTDGKIREFFAGTLRVNP